MNLKYLTELVNRLKVSGKTSLVNNALSPPSIHCLKFNDLYKAQTS